MPITANDINVLHQYAEGLLDRVGHHTDQLKGVALAVLGGIIWRGDPGTIRLRPHSGTLANLLWVEIGGKPYVFAYNHAIGEIELRDRTQGGTVLHSFSGRTPVADVEAIFRGL